MAGHDSIAYPTPQQDDPNIVFAWTPQQEADIARHIAKYPDKQSAVMPLLWIAQETWGWLPQGALQLVADTLQMELAQVYGVASFYTMYLKENKAPNLVEVCTCFACGECGGRELYAEAKQMLQVNDQGVSADGKIFLREAECLGACDSAVVVQINNRRMRFNVDAQAIARIFDQVRQGTPFEFVSVPLSNQKA
ncbi:MAG: NAD(P)H-dependent oxidoreductase subunit E [Bacteroidetes bacterium]|nr:NAD(P)H-dependent oxidoreductase subunit E [Bacteroidota bacterium]